MVETLLDVNKLNINKIVSKSLQRRVHNFNLFLTMASNINGVMEDNLRNSIKSAKVLLVGAGGIGCELLKNLVLTGFEDIELIDLDTIDVSNLNRQFLFQKQHVGRSKSEVAKESALRFNPKASIVAYHDSVTKPLYGVSFFRRFTIIMNALDNRAARSHVNRMSLASGVPLIESGTAGYLGQVTVIQKGLTECYECQPKPTQKTFPGCTIRNTPSEPIHCIVWAKHLFNQLFGEADPDEDVSPDASDPELVGDAGQAALDGSSCETGNVIRVSTRGWAASHNYDPQKLFTKFFHDDIKYLLSMDKLWEKRRKPTPLDWGQLPDDDQSTSKSVDLIEDQKPWSLTQCRDVFSNSVQRLHKQLQALGEGDHFLVWDKDDKDGLDFVASCANVRSYVFGIARKTRFDVKSMAGNIIPAIATTNAVIAGVIVMEALKLLDGRIDQCSTVYLNKHPNPRKRLLVPCPLDKPNAKCYVCSEKPEVTIRVNVERITVKCLEELVLKGALNMVAPDVTIVDGKGTILISSEEGETECNNDKILKDFSIVDGTQLTCEDFLQDYNLVISINQCTTFKDDHEFEVIGDAEKLRELQEKEKLEQDKAITDGQAKVAAADATADVSDDDDMVCLDDVAGEPSSPVSVTLKRKASTEDSPPIKKSRTTESTDTGVVELIECD